jgi:hypothetical protein
VAGGNVQVVTGDDALPVLGVHVAIAVGPVTVDAGHVVVVYPFPEVGPEATHDETQVDDA